MSAQVPQVVEQKSARVGRPLARAFSSVIVSVCGADDVTGGVTVPTAICGDGAVF